MVTHWCFLVPILAMGLIAAPDLATAQAKPTITVAGGVKKLDFTLYRGPDGEVGKTGGGIKKGVNTILRNCTGTDWSLTPTNPYVTARTVAGNNNVDGVGGNGYVFVVTVETDKGAVGTYILTFNAWNVVNGITNRTSETVTIIVGLDNDPSGGGHWEQADSKR